jgi:hypothetical protein
VINRASNTLCCPQTLTIDMLMSIDFAFLILHSNVHCDFDPSAPTHIQERENIP